MSRRPRLRLAGIPFHVIQRGNNRTACFARDEDYRRYLEDLKQQMLEHGVAVHAYVLMTNHVHLLLTPEHPDGLPLAMKFLGQRYVQYFNRVHGRSGTLWEGRYRSCLVDTESYLLTCHRYIESNPVRAGMVKSPGEYTWSSFRANAWGEHNPLLSPHSAIEGLGRTPDERRVAYRDLFRNELDAASIDEIRRMTNGGFALGTETFHRRISETCNGASSLQPPAGRVSRRSH